MRGYLGTSGTQPCQLCEVPVKVRAQAGMSGALVPSSKRQASPPADANGTLVTKRQRTNGDVAVAEQVSRQSLCYVLHLGAPGALAFTAAFSDALAGRSQITVDMRTSPHDCSPSSGRHRCGHQSCC